MKGWMILLAAAVICLLAPPETFRGGLLPGNDVAGVFGVMAMVAFLVGFVVTVGGKSLDDAPLGCGPQILRVIAILIVIGIALHATGLLEPIVMEVAK